jgi:hypothetical protein
MTSISKEQKARVLSQIKKMETVRLPPDDGGVAIGAFAQCEMAKCTILERSTDALTPVLRTEINANSTAADKNPKYALLRELTNGFLEYQQENGFPTEIQALRDWCSKVDVTTMKKDDPIGKRNRVGPGVVGNLSLCLGNRSIVKLDRHVIGVMEKHLRQKISRNGKSYSEFATSIGLEPRYLDCVLFKYGQAKNISA